MGNDRYRAALALTSDACRSALATHGLCVPADLPLERLAPLPAQSRAPYYDAYRLHLEEPAIASRSLFVSCFHFERVSEFQRETKARIVRRHNGALALQALGNSARLVPSCYHYRRGDATDLLVLEDVGDANLQQCVVGKPWHQQQKWLEAASAATADIHSAGQAMVHRPGARLLPITHYRPGGKRHFLEWGLRHLRRLVPNRLSGHVPELTAAVDALNYLPNALEAAPKRFVKGDNALRNIYRKRSGLRFID